MWVRRICKLAEVFWESVPKSWCSVGKGAVAELQRNAFAFGLVSCRSNFRMVFCQFVGKNIDYVYKLQHVQRMSTILLVIEIQLTNISPCQTMIASCVPLFRFDEVNMARISRA